ncbi:hypothetical protein GW17_00023428 [Ensete ventricosum]|nr:hypothetical protein GW17_00023428 [Ensete ventricosum]
MERHREARRGSMAAATANGGGGGGGGLSRRRQRNGSGFRDSPGLDSQDRLRDGRMEMPETSRLRDRGAKKDRDRDRSSRSKRRRGERTLHGSIRDRDEADESSEESIDQDEDEEDEDLSVPVRLPPSSPPLVNQAVSGGSWWWRRPNHPANFHFSVEAEPRIHHTALAVFLQRLASEEDGWINFVTISASFFFSWVQEIDIKIYFLLMAWYQKQVSGAKIRPPKISKSTSLSHDEIEMEVAEVLYGMTRQFECLPKHEGHKVDSRDVDGGSGNEAKSRVSSTNSLSPSPAAYPSAHPSSNSCSNPAPLAAIGGLCAPKFTFFFPPLFSPTFFSSLTVTLVCAAPKRKKPRPVKFDEESPTSPVGVQHLSSLSVPSVAKIDSENQIKTEASSPRSEKNSASAAIKNGGESVDVLVSDVQQQQESAKTKKGKTQELHTSTGGSNNGDKVESKEELVPRAKGSAACGGLDVNICDTAARKMVPDSPKEEMFKIDLMAPPPGKLSPERGDFNDFDPDQKPQGPDNETAPKLSKDKTEEKPAESTVTRDEQQTEKSVQRDIDSRKQVVIKQNIDLQLDLEKPKKDDSGIGKVQVQKQQAKDPKVEPKQEKSGDEHSQISILTSDAIDSWNLAWGFSTLWVCTANRAGAPKSTPGSGAEVRASGATSSAVGSCGGGGTANPVNLSFASLPPNEAQYVAFLQNNMYPFPAHISGATAFRGTSNAQAMPFFYPPHMLHPSQLRPQQQQPAGGPLPHGQPSHQNPGNLSGSSQKHPQQLHGNKGSVSVANANGCPATNQRQDHLPQHSRPMECKGMEDDLPTTDGTIYQPQKGIFCQTISMPIHPQNFALMSAGAAAIAMGNGGGHGDKQPVYQHKQNMKLELTPPQAFTIPFASFGGAGTATPGLDFSSMVQNHAILQSLPENSRHGYHQIPTAAVASTTQAAEQKKVHQVPEDVKSVTRELNTNMVGEEDRKIMVASKGPRHSFSFEKADNEPPISSVLSNSGVDISARSINLIQTSANGSRYADRVSGTATATTAATIVATSQQSQQHLIHLQKQQMQMQHQLASSRSKATASSNNTNMHPESLPGGSTVTKFPHALTGFPQAFVQGGSPIQWPHGKTSSGRLVDPAAAAAPPLMKNNVLQLQGRASQQPFPAQSHQTQISFGVNSNKMVAPGGQHLSGGCSSPSPSSAAGAVGSPSNSVNKNASGSPSASASAKPSPQTSAILLPQQSAVKQSASSSSSKSMTASNSNMPSILGHPQKVPAPSSNPKLQHQPHQSKQQPFSEAQIFFSNPHLQQVQCAQSSASPAAAQYYHKRQSEQQTRQSQQQQQQQTSAPSSAGMVSLCAPSALTLAGVPTASDTAKAMAAASVAAANNIKGLPPPGYYNAAQLAVVAQSASGSPRPPISATFPYMSLPPFTMKPSSEQKPAAGN